MATELEKKYRLNEVSYAELIERLRASGAAFEGEDVETNTIYSLAELTGRQGILRVRQTQARTIFTFKRRVASESDVKQQIEHETEVADAEAITAIIEELGLVPHVIYEKRRKTWSLPDAEVVLDELPFGLFMEIEGTVESIARTESVLRIENLPSEPRTYPQMTAEYGVRKGERIEARFTDADAS
jgi:adenylate cyclase class 2